MPPRTLPTRRHDNIMVGLVSIGTVLLAFGILLFIGYGPHSAVHQTFPILKWAIVLLILFALATDFVAMQRISQRVRHDLTFLLNENELIRKRPWFPDVRIPLQQIISAYEQSGCLVVAGGNPRRRIAVPKNVENFDLLLDELMKYATPVRPAGRIRLGWITSLLAVVCWWLLLFSANLIIVWVAGGVALALLGEWSFEIRHRLIEGPSRAMSWIMLGLAWLSAGFAIYVRVFAGRF
ncbi:MAG: hypothetical protein EPN47_12110 [Acidobacteria bacterium]|nr:MAG: hypothetical protein EPN47_12110 [Acidobacteriota bacterium]